MNKTIGFLISEGGGEAGAGGGGSLGPCKDLRAGGHHTLQPGGGRSAVSWDIGGL